MMALTTAQILCDVFQTCMSLSDDQIWIANQRREIPTDKKLYVIVGLLSSVPYGSNNAITTTVGMKDNLSQYVKESLTVDLLSYGTDAQERYNEILGSLMSTYAQQIQEQYALKFYTTPLNINDVSHVEGPATMNRISITLQALRKYSMILDAQYYDRITPAYVALSEQ